jgi:hypothetical protein
MDNTPLTRSTLSKIRVTPAEPRNGKNTKNVLNEMKEFRNITDVKNEDISALKPQKQKRFRSGAKSVCIQCFKFWYSPGSELLGLICTLVMGLVVLFIVAPIVLMFNAADAQALCMLVNKAPECSCRCYLACYETSTGQFSPYNLFDPNAKSLYSYHPSACAAEFAGVTLLRGGPYKDEAKGNGGGDENPCGVCPCGEDRCRQLYLLCADKSFTKKPAECEPETDVDIPTDTYFNPYQCHKQECMSNPNQPDGAGEELPLDTEKWATFTTTKIDEDCGRLDMYKQARDNVCKKENMV